MERDESKRLPQISDIYEKGLSLNAMSKSYGMPGARIGWIASKDENLSIGGGPNNYDMNEALKFARELIIKEI